MNSYRRLLAAACFLPSAAFVLIVAVTPFAHAATIWTGPAIAYSQPGTDPTQPANQDRLTPKVWLTRATTQGLFNAVNESAYDKVTKTYPSDTEWAYGALTNYASLTYTTWAAMSGNNPLSMVGQQAVVHLITEDIYLSVSFTFWGGSSGGFAYTRSTPSAAAPSPTVTITSPSAGAVFAAPANVKIDADATVSAGSVTNVAFFRSGTSLGSDQSSPFSITTSALGAGSYDLTAVATAAGVSATSAPVNITVVAPVAVNLTTPIIANGQFRFSYSANPGLRYVIQNSSNLVNWVALVTNVAASNPVLFTNSFTSIGARYFRVGRLPNP